MTEDDAATNDSTTSAAFHIWQAIRAADFRVLMAYKFGDPDALREVRVHLLDALGEIDAALAPSVIVDTNVTPDEPGEIWITPSDIVAGAI